MNKFFLKKIKKQLIIGFSKRAGKNCFGRKTIFTQSGGLKKKLYLIDFKRNFIGSYIILSIEKDVNRSGFIGLICYENGLFCYILLSNLNLMKIKFIFNGFCNFNKNSCSTFLFNISTGNILHHIEFLPGKGAQICRAAGVSAIIISKNNFYSFLKMNSGWLLKLSNYCIGINGNVSNENHFFNNLKKAGKNRQLGFRPIVRGISKNPCDHPHGGGEGRGSPPKAHKTPYGKLNKSPTKIKKNFILKKRKFRIFEKKNG